MQETTIEEKIIFMLLCESLNFRYIGEPKWKIEFNGTMYSGSYGLFYGIAKAIKQGHKLYNIDYLKELTIDDFNSILKGTREIPLLKERYDILKKLVKEIECIGNVYELFLMANNDQELLSIIVNNFSNFRDISIYDNKEVYFFKRATLLVEDLYQNIDGIRGKVKIIYNYLRRYKWKKYFFSVLMVRIIRQKYCWIILKKTILLTNYT